MKVSELRRHRKKSRLLPELLGDNPLLFIGLDLPFVVVTAVSLKNAAAISIQMFIIHFITMLVGWVIASRLQVWQRMFVTTGVAVVLMLISRQLVIYLIPDIENYAGMYLYLMAVNALTLFQANFLVKGSKLSQVIKASLFNILAFSSLMFGVSLFREVVGSGTIWHIPLPNAPRLTGVTAPFFGFIMTAFLLAILRYVNRQVVALSVIENRRRAREVLAAIEDAVDGTIEDAVDGTEEEEWS